MGTVRRLTQAEGIEVLGEAIGGLAFYNYEQDIRTLIHQKVLDPNGKPLSGTQESTLAEGAHRAVLLGLGYLVFVCPWERYKRVLKIKNDILPLEASLVFGLNIYSTEDPDDVLKPMYPSVKVLEWRPRSPVRPYWFASVLRNSIAHGQGSLFNNDRGDLVIELYNLRTDDNVIDFKIQIFEEDFVKLIKSSLMKFIFNGTKDGELEPLDILLK